MTNEVLLFLKAAARALYIGSSNLLFSTYSYVALFYITIHVFVRTLILRVKPILLILEPGFIS